MEFNKKRVKNLWNVFLIISQKTTKEIAIDTNQTQQNLSQKINNGTIRFIELLTILEKYGYTLQLKKLNK